MRFQRSFVLFVTLVIGVFSASLMAQDTPQSDTTAPSANSQEPQEMVDPGVIYNSKNPGSWVGKSVTLKNVLVEDTNNSGNFWVGSDSHHRLLVVRSENNPNISAMRFHKGDVVTVTGTIQPASRYEAKKTDAEKGSMHDAEKSSGVFLMANEISISSSTQH